MPRWGDVVQRSERYLPSWPSKDVVSLHAWFESHITRFSKALHKSKNVEVFEWQVDALECVLLKSDVC